MEQGVRTILIIPCKDKRLNIYAKLTAFFDFMSRTYLDLEEHDRMLQYLLENVYLSEYRICKVSEMPMSQLEYFSKIADCTIEVLNNRIARSAITGKLDLEYFGMIEEIDDKFYD